METPGATKRPKRRIPERHRRLFTLEQANRSLTLVKRIVGDIVKQHRLVASLEEQCHAANPKARGEAFEELRDRYARALERLRDLANELRAVGCELKDWQRGLVDFPARIEGRDVYLCWRLGEERVEFWHELDAGFHGRLPIDADVCERFAVADGTVV